MRVFLALLRKSPLAGGPSLAVQTIKPSPPAATTTAKETIVNALFGKYLLLTNTLSSGFLMVAGDFMSQQIENKKKGETYKHDSIRSGKMFVVGAIQGPIQHYFYGWIDRAIQTVTMANVGKKILLDQLIMSPVCIVAFFYPAGLLQGQDMNSCNAEIKGKFLEVYMTDCTVWPLAQFINFYYLKPKYRVIYVSLLTMLYNVYLSYVKHRTDEQNQNDSKSNK